MTHTWSNPFSIHKLPAVILALFAIFLFGCNKQRTGTAVKAEAGGLAVKTVQVEPQALPLTIAVTGSLVSNAAVDVKAETTGRLLKFVKQEGDTISAGEIVASVDEENYRIAVRQAQTAVQVADAALARTRVLSAHSKSELERAQNLVRSGGITEKDLQAAQMADRDAQAQVAVAEAQLAQARASLDASEKRLRDASIRSPISGTIQKKFINAGAYLEPATLVLSIVDNRQLELESPVPSAQLGQVRAGQGVKFHVNSYPGTTFAGRVIEINPAVDALSRSAKVRIAVENSGDKLKTGMFAEGEILTGVQQQAIVVPAVAVYRGATGDQDSYVFVVEDNKAAKRAVKLGRETDSRLEIASGLKAGDVLIAEQRIELADGVRVEPGK